MSKSSKLLHLDPVARALEKRAERERGGEKLAETSQPILSSQLSEQPDGGPLSSESSGPLAARSQPRPSRDFGTRRVIESGSSFWRLEFDSKSL
jgi:hypothetical protein